MKILNLENENRKFTVERSTGTLVGSAVSSEGLSTSTAEPAASS